MLIRVTPRSNSAKLAAATAFVVFSSVACDEVPARQQAVVDKNDAGVTACVDDSDCLSGVCNKDLGTCEGRPGRDGVSCLPEAKDDGCIEIVCGDTRTDPICSGQDGTDGRNGTNGKPGANGEDGTNGVDGTGCTVARHGNCIIVTCGATSAQAGDCSGNTQPDADVSEPDATSQEADAGIPMREPDASPSQDDAARPQPDASEQICDGDQDQVPENPQFCDLDDDGGTGGDCDDHNAEVKPGADEACDGVDNDCDGVTDEDCANNTVSIHFQLPRTEGVQLFTDLVTLYGCMGSEVDWDNLDGPNGRLLCNTSWRQFYIQESDALDIVEVTAEVEVEHHQGFEFNFDSEYLNGQRWACGFHRAINGTISATGPEGEMEVYQVANRSDEVDIWAGCNFWIWRN